MTFLIADGTNALHRAHYAVPPLSYKGQPTNALMGYFRIMRRYIRETKAKHFVSTFDRKGTNFRHKLHPEYKGTRDKKPEVSAAIHSQTPIAKDMLLAHGLAVVGKIGVEADDIVGCMVRWALENYDGLIYISSNDKDFAQLLVDKRVRILNANKDIVIDYKNCKDVYGFKPKHIIDFLMLDGDEVDNIPGVPGVGLKTAQKLIGEYGKAEKIPHDKFPKGARETVNFKQQFKLTRKLVTIRDDVYDPSMLDTEIHEPDVKAFNKLCKRYNLTSLML